MEVWMGVSFVLLALWLVLFIFGTGYALFGDEFHDNEDRKEFFQAFAAIMSAAFIFALFHWIVLLAILPGFLLYGIYQGVKILITKPWRPV